jgi:hypothetical protein
VNDSAAHIIEKTEKIAALEHNLIVATSFHAACFEAGRSRLLLLPKEKPVFPRLFPVQSRQNNKENRHQQHKAFAKGASTSLTLLMLTADEE